MPSYVTVILPSSHFAHGRPGAAMHTLLANQTVHEGIIFPPPWTVKPSVALSIQDQGIGSGRTSGAPDWCRCVPILAGSPRLALTVHLPGSIRAEACPPLSVVPNKAQLDSRDLSAADYL